jgi:hypothetical protein
MIIRRLYLELFPFLPFAPILIVGFGIALLLHVSRRRWVIHVSVFVSFLVVPLAYLSVQALVDPTTVEFPGPGDGLVALLYLWILIPSALGYLVFAWLASRQA